MKLAAVFPGQGSQAVGMGKFLFDEFDYVRAMFDEASDVLKQDFTKLCFEGPESELMLTHNTQPALVLVSSAYFRVLEKEFGLKASMGAGHSVGEYSACVAAQVMPLAHALVAVRKRGEAMQSAVPVGDGAMMAVMGLDDVTVSSVCAWVTQQSGEVLQPANFNCPGQVVISGSARAAQWLQENIKQAPVPADARIKLIPLKVSAPFHCALMMPAQKVMEAVLADIDFKDAAWPIFQNVTASAVTTGQELRQNLVTQVSGSVRWTESVKAMFSHGANTFVECGHGKVLAGLIKKIAPEAEVLNFGSLEDIKSFSQRLKA